MEWTLLVVRVIGRRIWRLKVKIYPVFPSSSSFITGVGRDGLRLAVLSFRGC